MRQAELAESQGDPRRAASLYAALAERTPVSPEDVLMRLAHASLTARRHGGRRAGARAIYYDTR